MYKFMCIYIYIHRYLIYNVHQTIKASVRLALDSRTLFTSFLHRPPATLLACAARQVPELKDPKTQTILHCHFQR